MKKIILLSAIAIVAAFSASAQGFRVGLKAGADINKIAGKSFKDQFSFGYQTGGFASINISKKLGIQPEVIFSQVNIDTTSSFQDVYQVKDIGDIKLQYLKIPLLLNYSPNKFVSLQAGPQYGILLNKGTSLVNNGANAFKEGDFSMLAGMQLNISKILIYGRYGVGLNNLNDLGNSERWKNQNIQLGFGLRF